MTEGGSRSRPLPPDLYGLVLAGGRGSRLGRDKGSLIYHGVPQVRWALDLLGDLCARAFVSVRPEQARQPLYRALPLIEDVRQSAGPATGLAAAMQRFPQVAWLVMAADMPLLTRSPLARLVAERAPALLATAYCHSDGTPEPLCAIWEPAAWSKLIERWPGGGVSLRRLLELGPARLLDPERAEVLTSVNTELDDQRVRRQLSGSPALM
jgi:molybdopterin-guanine dinucleotide biosynthesis protein A